MTAGRRPARPRAASVIGLSLFMMNDVFASCFFDFVRDLPHGMHGFKGENQTQQQIHPKVYPSIPCMSGDTFQVKLANGVGVRTVAS